MSSGNCRLIASTAPVTDVVFSWKMQAPLVFPLACRVAAYTATAGCSSSYLLAALPLLLERRLLRWGDRGAWEEVAVCCAGEGWLSARLAFPAEGGATGHGLMPGDTPHATQQGVATR